jgi:hypothetical protein
VGTQQFPYGGGLGDTVLEFDQNTPLTNSVQADVKSGAATFYGIQIDGRQVTEDDASVNLYDAAAPTVGTTAPTLSFPVIKNLLYEVICKRGFAFTNLSIAASGARCGDENVAPAGTLLTRLAIG